MFSGGGWNRQDSPQRHMHKRASAAGLGCKSYTSGTVTCGSDLGQTHTLTGSNLTLKNPGCVRSPVHENKNINLSTVSSVTGLTIGRNSCGGRCFRLPA